MLSVVSATIFFFVYKTNRGSIDIEQGVTTLREPLLAQGQRHTPLPGSDEANRGKLDEIGGAGSLSSIESALLE